MSRNFTATAPNSGGLPTWKTGEDAKLVTLSWFPWHITNKRNGYLAGVPSAEFEETFYATNGPSSPGGTRDTSEPPSDL